MILYDDKNYQPVVIKTLNQNDGKASKPKIIQELQNANPEFPDGYFTTSSVFRVLSKNNFIIKFNEKEKQYELINYDSFTTAQKAWITTYCDVKIGTEVKDFLEKFDGIVNKTQLQVLRKFSKKSGKNMRAKRIFGDREKGEKLPADRYVDEKHYLHNLIRGVYKPEGVKFAQALMSSPQSRWELELDREHPTLRIIYDFHDSSEHKVDIDSMNECFKINLPIGLFFRLKKNLYKCLGLGKIVSVTGTKFIIDSFGIPYEESSSLKEQTLLEYDSLTKERTVSTIENVDFEKITRDDLKGKFSSNDLTYTVQLDRRSLHLSNIIEKCESGELVIPDFQRFFIWSKEMVQTFFDSIFNGYYIGPFLFWEPMQKGVIGTSAIHGVETKNLIENQIIIDGQQRVSSIYYALRSPDFPLRKKESRTYFYIDFGVFLKNFPNHEDVIKTFSKEIDHKDQYSKLLFPLNQLENYELWIDKLEIFLEDNFSQLDHRKDLKPLLEIIRTKLRFILREFECPYISLQNIDLNDVVEIFTRINTTGQKLNAFDLLIAKLSQHDIKLRNLWDNGCKNHRNVERYLEKSKNSTQGLPILHSMSMCFTESGSCKRSEILTIFERMNSNKDDFENKWNEMLEYTDLAIELLEEKSDDGFGVIDPNYLPSESMIPILTSLLYTTHKKFKNSNKSCDDKIKNWYWTSAFTNAYSGSSDSQKTSDYKQIVKWFSDGQTPQTIINFRENFFKKSSLDLSNVSKKGSSTFNAVLSLSALHGSKDWANNRLVRNQNTSVKQYWLDVDHIFPKSKYSDDIFNESILNKTWQSKETNEHRKIAKDPDSFLSETLKSNFQNNLDDLLDNMKTHFVNHEGYDALMNNDSQKFIEEREHEILKEIGSRIGAPKMNFIPPLKSQYEEQTNEIPVEELIKMPESDTLEFKATMLFDLNENTANKTLRNVIGKTITGFLNNKGGILVVGYDQLNHEIVGIEKDYQLYGDKIEEDIAWDKWQLTFNNMLKSFLKPSHASSLIQQVEPKKIGNKTLVVIRVVSSNEGVYFDNQFFVRRIGATEKLEGRDLADYIKSHFN